MICRKSESIRQLIIELSVRVERNMEPLLNIVSDWYLTGSVLVTTLFVVWLVRWLNSPYDYLKDLTDIGYAQVQGLKPNRTSRTIEVERIRRTRQPGRKAPPPFPNGWYMVSESALLPTSSAISVDIIGNFYLNNLKLLFKIIWLF